MKCSKLFLLGGLTLALTGPVYAQETVDDRISALEAEIKQLKEERAADKAAMEDVIETKHKAHVEMAAAKKPKDGFMVGDTNIKIGGFIDFDLHVNQADGGGIGSTSIARDFYIPSVTPIGGDDSTFTDLSAEASRFYFTASKPAGDKKVTAHLEMDFLGSGQGNELVSNSYSPRLRRAYIDYGNWRLGQEWSTFQNTSAIPESASFLALPDGMVFIRQAQIRYTSGNWQFAIENPNTTSLNVGSRDENVIPDVIVRYNKSGDFGNVSFAAMGRQLRADFGATEEETFGWALSAAGRVKVGEKDDIRFNLTGGEGLGRYIGLAASRAVAQDADGELEAITSYGGLIAWRHPFGETARFNIGYSGLFIDNPDYLTPTAVNKQVQSAYAAVLWDVAPKVTMGAEILHGIRELESGDEGNLTRLTFSSKYAF